MSCCLKHKYAELRKQMQKLTATLSLQPVPFLLSATVLVSEGNLLICNATPQKFTGTPWTNAKAEHKLKNHVPASLLDWSCSPGSESQALCDAASAPVFCRSKSWLTGMSYDCRHAAYKRSQFERVWVKILASASQLVSFQRWRHFKGLMPSPFWQ